MKFLTYFHDKKLGIYFKYLLENTFSCAVVVMDEQTSFFKELEKSSEYNFCLFSTNEVVSDTNLFKMIELLASTPTLYVSENQDRLPKLKKLFSGKKITLIESLSDVQQSLKQIAFLLDIKYDANDLASNFIPIRQDVFLKIDHVGCDVFIKLSDDKYLKIFSRGSEITAKELVRVHKKNIDYLYVRLADFEDFLNSIDAFETDYSELPYEEASAKKAEDLTHSYEMFYHITNKVQLNQKALGYANKSVGFLFDLMEKNDDLKSFWKFFSAKKNFLSEHSFMVGFLSNAILSQTMHANTNNSLKLSLAALLHDVGIKQDKTWDLEKHDDDDHFSVREVEVFKGHMFNSVDVLNKFDEMPMDIDKIILQHHEKYDGSGYPRGIGWSKIPFLVSVFIVAHEAVVHLFNTNYSEESLTEFIALKKNEYKEGSFKEVILALEKIR